MQVTVGADIGIERNVAAAETGVGQGHGRGDPVHAEMAEAVAARVPGDEIPERRQDQHGLRLDRAEGARALAVAIAETQELAVEERRLKGGKKTCVHWAKVGEILFRGKLADMQTVEEPAQVAQTVGRQRAFDLGEAGVGHRGEWQASRRAHCSDTDEKGEDLGHGKAGRGLYRLRIKLQTATASGLGVDDKALVPQGADVAQDRAARGPGFLCKRGYAGAAAAAEVADEGILAGAAVLGMSLAVLVTDRGTISP